MTDWRTEIEAMLLDDLEAVERFFTTWHPRIHRWASGGEHSWRADSDDVAQEVLIKLTRNHCRALVEWHGMESDPANTEASLSAYLRRTCQNMAHDLCRARGRNRTEPLDETDLLAGPDSDPLALLEGEVLREALAEAFAYLSMSEKAACLGTHSPTSAMSDMYRDRQPQLEDYAQALQEATADAHGAAFAVGVFQLLAIITPSESAQLPLR